MIHATRSTTLDDISGEPVFHLFALESKVFPEPERRGPLPLISPGVESLARDIEVFGDIGNAPKAVYFELGGASSEAGVTPGMVVHW